VFGYNGSSCRHEHSPKIFHLLFDFEFVIFLIHEFNILPDITIWEIVRIEHRDVRLEGLQTVTQYRQHR
jgi:hypothetical protein